MDPTRRARLTAALKSEIAALPPQLRRAAKYVVDHPSDFGLDSVRETARKAGVSTYTLVKLAKHMGVPGFEAFRAPFRRALVDTVAPGVETAWLDARREAGPSGAAYAEAAANAMGIVARSLEHQDVETLEAVADLLTAAPRVYLTAARSSYAMAYYLHYVGRMALPELMLIPRHRNSAIDDLNDARPGDALVAITAAPYSRETIEACEFACARGVRLVMICDSEIGAPGLQPDHLLLASVHSTHHFGCYAGMLAVIELLLALLMQRGGEAARARIASYDRLRETGGAYWSGAKKH